jgi:hypothetical protein
VKLRHNHLAIQLALDNAPVPECPPITNGQTINALRALGDHDKADAFARYLIAIKPLSTPPSSSVPPSLPSEQCPATPAAIPVQGHPDGGVVPTRQLTEDEWWAGIALDDSANTITGEQAAKLLRRMRWGWPE